MKEVIEVSDSSYILELKDITKTFIGVAANKDINLKVKKGEIHALLGENGAGKTTLMNVLSGLYAPDYGEIFIDGKKVNIKGPKDSLAQGIGMVHQHFKLVEELTVAENIVIGHKDLNVVMHRKELEDQIREMSERYKLPIEPKTKVHDLSAGEKQRVEIIKMLYRNVDLLILDEPTSVLTPQETDQLFDYIRQMKKEKKTVIFISHKLNEVMQIADRVSILRKGELIETMEAKDTNPKDLTMKMIGRALTAEFNTDEERSFGDEIMTCSDLVVKSDDGIVAVDHVNFKLHKGEIYGIAGVSGNGQTELAEAITGMRKAESGTLVISGKEMRISKSNTKAFINEGMAHIPEDRNSTGTIQEFSCIDNVILKKYKKEPISGRLVMHKKEAEKIGNELLGKYDVRASSYDLPTKALSGGNTQKLILARELENDPKIIVAVHPTYGLDVLAAEMVYKCLLEERDKGCAVILFSESLDELFLLSDTIAVMFKHELVEERKRDAWTISDIGFAMMGLEEEEEGKEVLADD